MTRQMFLHELFDNKPSPNDESIRILNWNLRNPSKERAKLQAEWLLETKANIVVLSEAKNSDGCRYIANWLESYGFKIILPNTSSDEYCVMLGAKGFETKPFSIDVAFLP